jgi:YbbR domain-containing protein
MEKTPTKSAGLKLISILLAVLLWMYVVNKDEFSTKQNYTDVMLQYYNLSDGLTVSGPDTVSVRLWGNFKQTGEIVAYVDLSQLGQGEYNLPVKVKPVSGAMFVSVQPDQVRVKLQRTKEDMTSINYEISQNPPAGFKLVDVIIEPSKCLVKGEQSNVNQVAKVVAPLKLGQVKDISSLKADLIAYDSNGEMVSDVIMVPSTVSVYAVVQQDKKTVTAAVKPQFTGEVADGYHFSGYNINPETVSLLGSEQALSQLTQVDTAPIDLNGKNASFSQIVTVVVPSGTNVYPAQVTVAVELTKDPEKEVP